MVARYVIVLQTVDIERSVIKNGKSRMGLIVVENAAREKNAVLRMNRTNVMRARKKRHSTNKDSERESTLLDD